MAKYVITKNEEKNFYWQWWCKNDPTIGGFANSKKEAKQQAKEQCGKNNEAEIIPPSVDFTVKDGFIQEFSCENLAGEIKTHDDIDEDIFLYLSGFDCTNVIDLCNYEVVAAILKIWDIFIDGNSTDEIMRNHNLTRSQFNMLLDKSWTNIEIEIDDEDRTNISWNFFDC